MGSLGKIIPAVLSEEITAVDRNKHGSGNNFILPVIPVQESQKQFWENLHLHLSHAFERERRPFGNDFIYLLQLLYP